MFDEGGKIYRRKLKDELGHILTEDEIRKVSSLKFSGWSRLSREFLEEVKGYSYETEEGFESIIQVLEDTNDNLMQALSSKYTFTEELNKRNQVKEGIEKISYDNVMRDSYISAPVKRMVWQTIQICEEIRSIQGGAPEKIFLEMTRNPELKKTRKDSRRSDLIALYKKCKDDVSHFIKELESYEDRDLRAKKLFLYYRQKGRSMYTGETIDLGHLLKYGDSNLGLYDIDHIYPKSLTKDDSFDNLVLVERKINAKKSDGNLSDEIKNRMKGFWYQLYSEGFLSKKKYERLTRRTELSTEELSGFINRQLVETSQSTKAVADILQKIYPDTKMVYVKARVVSDFRRDFKILKCRELNDFHHGEDAYLNIVCGNAYNVKFTDNPYNYIKKNMDSGKRRFYNLEEFFEKEVKRNGVVAWDKERDLPKVLDAFDRNSVNVTRMSFVNRGALFNATIRRKTDRTDLALAPLKGVDERLSDFSKYGGYSSLSGSYYIAVKHIEKKKEVITLEQVYSIHEKDIKTPMDLKKYCENVLGLDSPEVLNKKIKLGSKIQYDGFEYYLQGRVPGGCRLACSGRNTLPRDLKGVFRKIATLGKENQNQIEDLEDKDFSALYNHYLEKLKDEEFSKRLNNPIKLLEENYECFKDLGKIDKARVLLNIHYCFDRRSLSGVNLSLINGSANSCICQINKKINGHDVVIINESPTGLHVNRKVLCRK